MVDTLPEDQLEGKKKVQRGNHVSNGATHQGRVNSSCGSNSVRDTIQYNEHPANIFFPARRRGKRL